MASWQARSTSFVLRHWFKPTLARAPDAPGGAQGHERRTRAAAARGARRARHGGRYRWRVDDGRRRADSRDAAVSAWRRLLRLHAADVSRRSRLRSRSQDSGRLRRTIASHPSIRFRRDSTMRSPRIAGCCRITLRNSSWSRATRRAAASAWRCCCRCVSAAFRCRPLQCCSRRSSISLRPESLRAPTARAARCSTSDSFGRAAQFYVGDGDRRAPLASPLYADLHGLPPLLIHVGADETLLDDSRRLAERAQRAGVKVAAQGLAGRAARLAAVSALDSGRPQLAARSGHVLRAGSRDRRRR